MNNGWITVHRKIMSWEWYGDSRIVHTFIHCLFKANHKQNKWQGALIERGQFITSVENMANDINCSIQQMRTILKKLKSTNEITIKTTTKYSIISITNYEQYQDSNKQDNKQITNEQQTNNKQITNKQQQTTITTTKQPNNENKREGKKRFASPSLQDIQDCINEKNYCIDADIFYNHYESNGWKVGNNSMKSWKAALANWNSREDKKKPLNDKDRFYAEMRSDSQPIIEGDFHVVK